MTTSHRDPSLPDADQPHAADSTTTLLERARAGDREALDRLFARTLPLLKRWASGRLPRWARDLADTHDLVQEAMLQTFTKIDTFEVRGEGALQAYLRQAVLNRIRDHIRRVERRPGHDEFDGREPSEDTSPLEAAIGHEALERYEGALARLSAGDRELVIGSVEMGYSYEQLAEATGKPSVDAARKAAKRALVRLAEEMKAASRIK